MMMASQLPVAHRATNSGAGPGPGRPARRPARWPAGRAEELAGELLEHVVRHDDGGLADQAEAAQLHRAHDHLGGLARADLVGQQTAGSLMIRATAASWCGRGRNQRQAGQRQLRRRRSCAAPGVEPVVVGAGQRGRAVRVLPDPFGEPSASSVAFSCAAMVAAALKTRRSSAVLIGDVSCDLMGRCSSSGLRDLGAGYPRCPSVGWPARVAGRR